MLKTIWPYANFFVKDCYLKLKLYRNFYYYLLKTISLSKQMIIIKKRMITLNHITPNKFFVSNRNTWYNMTVLN